MKPQVTNSLINRLSFEFYFLKKNTAPGSYMPEKVNLDHSPAFTFGQKLIQKTVSDTPGKK